MRDLRLVRNATLLCLPALLLVAGGFYFLREKVPELERNERERVIQQYREQARDAKEKGRGEPFDFAASGFKQNNRRINRESWGYAGNIVWYFKRGVAYKLEAQPVEETSVVLQLYAVCIFVMSLFVVMTVIWVRYFWRFSKARDDFLSAVAHDLTTPLVGLRMMIGRNDEEARKLNERMLLIVGNLKDFLKLGGRRRAPEPKPFDVVALVQEAYRLFSADYEETEGGAVTFQTFQTSQTSQTDSLSPIFVLADETMTLQILWNLFGNDLKYAAAYGKVTVRFGTEDGFVTVSFVDEGQGMTPRQRRHAFDRYYRAKTVLQSGKGGFGIGLCTAREFARAMGGDLTVRANSPRGCVFTLRLPADTSKARA